MSLIVFDTSTLISIVTNNLLPTLESLREKIKGEFVISREVRRELVDYPLTTKRFELEAIIVMNYLNKGYLKMIESNVVREKAKRLLELANKIYRSKRDYIKIIDMGEMEALTLAIHLNADAYVVDERTMRMLIENPEQLGVLLNKKLHTKIEIDNEVLKEFKENIKNITVLRSVELMTVAYESGLLDDYITNEEIRIKLLDGILWGLKLRGCSVSENEINEILKLENK